MYNEFDPKHYKGKWPCTTKTLYNEKTLIGRLHQYFLIYFETFSVPLGYRMWQKKAPLNQTGSDRMKYIPLLLYSLRWNIETSYYEQKTFWSFCNYMVRSCKGIEMLVNLINISYCAMKILPYQNEHFSEYRTKSVQEFRFELSQGIRSQIFFATFVKNIETHIKSNAMTKALKQLIHQQVYHL